MAICNPCAQVSNDSKKLIARYKKEYEEGKSDYYVFRTQAGQKVSFVKKEYFNVVFHDRIKPNFDNGAEYWHISEFKYSDNG